MGFQDRDYYRDHLKRIESHKEANRLARRVVSVPWWRRHFVPLVAAVAVVVGYGLRWWIGR